MSESSDPATASPAGEAARARASGATGSAPRVLLYVVNDAWFLASHRFELVRAAVEAGHEVHIAARRDASVERFEAIGCRFHDWRLAPRGTGPRAELVALAALARIIRSVRPELLHLVTIKALLYGGLLARTLRVPAVVFAVAGLGNFFVGSSSRERLVGRLFDGIYGVVLRHPNRRVIVQNDSDREHFVGAGRVPDAHVALLPGSGVDLERFAASPEPPGALKVLLASRLLWKKGVAEYVEAARRRRAAGSTSRFVLAGTIDAENPESVTRGDVEGWVEEGVIDWRGQCEDMVGLLRECHVVCLPTYYGEGLPKVLIEACASARAIVCTDWPGCREIVRDDVNGLLIPPRDAAALAGAIEALEGDPARRHRLGATAREIAERSYAVETVVARTFEIYAELLAGADRSGGRGGRR